MRPRGLRSRVDGPRASRAGDPWRVAALACAAAACLAAATPSSASPPSFTAQEVARILKLSPLPPPPPNETNRVADDERAAALGHRLFFDPRLSPDGTFSCATCHDPAKAFADGLPVAAGRTPRPRNAPTLLNSAHARWLNWDGSADTLWAQALGPIEHPEELDGDRVSAVRLVAKDPALRSAYEALFGPLPPLDDTRVPDRARPARPGPSAGGAASDRGDGGALDAAWRAMSSEDRKAIDAAFANLGKSIEAYERRLRSAASPFDRFVEGLRADDPQRMAAISPAAQRGLQLFVGSANCRLCHSGPNFTDGEFHAVGIPARSIVTEPVGAGAGGGAADATTDDRSAAPEAGRFEGLRRLAADPFNAHGAFSDAPNGPRAERTRAVVHGPETWGQVRTPSLRNVALTAPYMHAGQFGSLPRVVRFYSTLEEQVLIGHHRETILTPLRLNGSQIADLVAFLESLTGEGPPARWTAPPVP